MKTQQVEIVILNPKEEKDYYTVQSPNQYGDIWIRHASGEGMGVNAQQLFDYFDKWFKENM